MGFSSITIDTNGYLFNDILFKTKPEEVDLISFSLDGATRSTNDLIRGEDCYDTCISGIRKAIKLGFNVNIKNLLSFNLQNIV